MNWIKVENDAPAVLRALADGKKVRRDSWDDKEWVRLGGDGRMRGEDDSHHVTNDFSGVWYIEPERDIATDPQAGDEFISGRLKCRVRFVHDGVVVWEDDDSDGYLYAGSLAKWTELWADKVYTRAK